MDYQPTVKSWIHAPCGERVLGVVWEVQNAKDSNEYPTVHYRRARVEIGFGFFAWRMVFKWGHHTKDDGC